MLDIRLIRETPEVVEAMLAKRGASGDVAALRELDARKRALIVESDDLRSQRKTLSGQIGGLMKAGDREGAEAIKATVAEVATRLDTVEAEQAQLDAQVDAALLALPNIVQDSVPVGGEGEGDTLRTWGEPRAAGGEGGDPAVRDHLELGTALGIIDMERGARTSGSRFAYLMGDAVRLQYALVQFALAQLTGAGFVPVVPPVLVREEAMQGTGFFPAERSQIYPVPEEDGPDLFLVGTSEVPLAALHADEILDPAQLPLRYAGVSSCFRREAGSAGKDQRGIFRVHQFDKVEMFSFVEPDASRDEHLVLLAQEEAIMQALELPYRVVNIAAGDLGASASQKFDIEAWIPSQGRYRELTSTSNCTDYQARRLKCRIRRDKGTEVAHTLNGTAIAIGRTLVALLENGQQHDGTVRIPEVLQRFGAPAVVASRTGAAVPG